MGKTASVTANEYQLQRTANEYTARRQLQSRSVLDSFGVVLMSCKVDFHVVRSALQNSHSVTHLDDLKSHPVRKNTEFL